MSCQHSTIRILIRYSIALKHEPVNGITNQVSSLNKKTIKDIITSLWWKVNHIEISFMGTPLVFLIHHYEKNSINVQFWKNGSTIRRILLTKYLGFSKCSLFDWYGWFSCVAFILHCVSQKMVMLWCKNNERTVRDIHSLH